MAVYKHMTESERERIEEALDSRETFKAIGTKLGRDPTTIKKEVVNRLYYMQQGCFGYAFNDCSKRAGCEQSYLCKDNESCRRHRCKGCKICRKVCGEYEKEVCARLLKPPFVCNGCRLWSKCTLERRVYKAYRAQREYSAVLSESRSGIDADPERIAIINSIVKPLLKKGQSPHVIYENHKDELMVSEKTLYNYVGMGVLDAGNIDLPRKVRYRKRKSKAKPCKVDKACHQGRTLVDFLDFMSANPNLHVVEMDTVEGKKGGSVLLTLHFIDIKFMLAFWRPTNDAKSVKDIFDGLYERLGPELFRGLFPVLLGDRGSEFSDPLGIEFDPDGEERCRVFYCDPQRSDQKGALEKNHEHIRCVIPKGVPMDGYDQADIDWMMNNVNAYLRKSIGNRTPYEVFVFAFGEDAAKKLGLEYIDPDDVTLTPALLKKTKP